MNGKLNLVPVTEEDAFATVNEIVNYVTKVNISWEIGVWVAGRAFIWREVVQGPSKLCPQLQLQQSDL